MRSKPEGSSRAPQPPLESAPAAAHRCAWRWDPIAHRAVCSDDCAALFGLPPGTTLSYEGLLSTVHPDDRGAVKEAIQRALAGDSQYEVEYRVIWPDGTVHRIA